MKSNQKVLIVGCGNMGRSHARAYTQLEGVQICGLVARRESKNKLKDELA